MQRLPLLAVGSVVWRLPLREATAARLAAALLSGDAPQQRTMLQELLRDDAALAVWAVCRLQSISGEAINSIEQLAELLLSHWRQALQWTAADAAAAGAAKSGAGADCEQKWNELFRLSTTAAQTAVSLAQHASCSRETLSAAELLGLLSYADDWLAACRDRSAGPRDQAKRADCLPLWLRESLAALARDPADNAAAGFVAAVRRQVHDERARQAQSSDATDGLIDGLAVDHGIGWAQLLPQLTRRLARLSELETRFDTALEREKIESLYHFAYGASHEINNPLANISSRAQLLLRDETDHRRREMLASINAQAFRGHEMILNVMHFARPPQPAPAQVDLADLACKVVAELSHEAEQQGTLLFCAAGNARLLAHVDPDHIAAALRALCVNSLESLGAGGQVEVGVGRSKCHDQASEWAELTVRDTGPGIPEHVRPHIFDPFYSGREAGRGLGFGLSKSWRIVAMHGGRIDVGGGTGGAVFTIRLPLESAAASAQKAVG